MVRAKRILVVVLDWGLGHATRCIPLIRSLQKKEQEVLIGGGGESLRLLQKEFPELIFFQLPGYNPQYPSDGSMVAKMIRQLPGFFSVIKKEHGKVEELVREQKIDLVISDNRYGCWSKHAYSVFITHQSNILMPRRFGWLTGVVRYLNKKFVRKFDECWLPDYPESKSLAGQLIRFGKNDFHRNVRYIGNLSRFACKESMGVLYDILAICSGPEPQRSQLENILTVALDQSPYRYCIVRGVISDSPPVNTSKATIFNYLTTGELEKVILQSKLVIARSGYSTVMDMSALRKKAIFIPTPGQTEQEYLATRLMERGIAYSMAQKDFDLSKAITESAKFSGFESHSNDDYLEPAIDHLLQQS